MSTADAGPSGPDLRLGFPIDRIPEGGMVAGLVDGEPVLLAKRGAVIHAVGGTCTHYSGPLAEGLIDGDTVHCPLHHACFDLRTGAALRGPALAPLPCYRVERRLDRVFVLGPATSEARTGNSAPGRAPAPARIVIAGAGAAGAAAGFALRRAGYAGQITMIGAEAAAPYDRPNLSKAYLAGNAPADWLPLQPAAAYEAAGIRLTLGVAIAQIDPNARTVSLEDGRVFPFDALLLAPGAQPIRPSMPGVDGPRVFTIRSLADADALLASTATAQNAVVIGAGFLGLEAAASLRARGLGVQVVSPDARPLEKVLGPGLAARIQRLHESHGVVLHLQRSAVEIQASSVLLDSGEQLPADLVVVATGVRPNTALAVRAGLAISRGIQVDRYLETSRSGIFAAGDAVRWPAPRTGELIGCAHWSLAMRMGAAAAGNMLGDRTPFEASPFFWSEHYDEEVKCTGVTEQTGRIEVLTGLPDNQWEQRHWQGDRLVAVATINRDHASLVAELDLERQFATPAARAALGNITGARRSTP